VGQGRSRLSMRIPHPGWHEQDAQSWWLALRRALRQALAGLDPLRLDGMAISCQRESFVPVDAHGNPLCPALLWMDERAAPCLPDLSRAISPDTFHHLTGKPLTANLTATKIAWLRLNAPEIYAAAHSYLDTHAYFLHCLTGQPVSAWGSADPTGLFDMRGLDWAGPVLEALGLHRGQLPRLGAPGDVVGVVSPDAARATGLPAGLAVMAGSGDGQAGGLGANICAPGEAYLTLGTSVVSGTFTQHYRVSQAFRTMTAAIRGAFMLETVLLGGTYTIDWLVGTLLGRRATAGQRMRARLEEGVGQIPRGSDGLVLVPYWNSVMNPYWDANASGIVVGLRGAHTPAHLYRAILEGIACELRLQLDGVEKELGQHIRRIAVMGGGSRSRSWLQIIADVTGHRLQRLEISEASALGAGILAATGAGWYPNTADAALAMTPLPSEVIQPDAAGQEFYDSLYTRVYQHLYPALRQPQAELEQLGRAAWKTQH
jgi:sugar (pentulose or hexulose) kinase